MRKDIVFEDGQIQLGGKNVPGLLTELRVDGKVRFDEQKVDGASGKSKIPQGYEDADIMLGVILLSDDESTSYDKAAELATLFKNTDTHANPQVFTVVNRHVQARGIKQVVFSRLETAENDQSDEIRATLAFVEHVPPIVRTEKSQVKTPTPGEVARANAARKGAEPEVDSIIVDAS